MSTLDALSPSSPDDPSPPLRELLVSAVPMLTRFVRQRFPGTLQTYESATDVVQSICGKLLGGGVPFEYRNDAQLHVWLKTVAQREVRARLRRLHTQKHDVRRQVAFAESQHGVGEDDSPAARCQQMEDRDQLDRAIALLPDGERDLIIHRYLCQQRPTQIAADRQISVAATKNRISRAKAKLARILDELTGDQ